MIYQFNLYETLPHILYVQQYTRIQNWNETEGDYFEISFHILVMKEKN